MRHATLPLLLLLASCVSRSAALIEDGRSLLDEGKNAEAESAFQEALALDGGSFESELWLLRAWMELGRTNDALDRIDELARSDGRDGPAIDYLYGMAFARRAQDQVALGVSDMNVQMNFEDAVKLLSSAVEAEPERFRDAYLPLARSAWMSLDLDRARPAAERAVALNPAGVDERLLLGDVALSQFQVAHTQEPWGEAAQGHWQAARDAFASAAELSAPPTDELAAWQLSQAELKLGHTLLWKELTSEARDAYARSASWSPEGFDFKTVNGVLARDDFHAFVVDACARLDARSSPAGDGESEAEAPAGHGTLLWWLGWSHLAREEFEAAEEAFVACLEARPDFLNARFYIALARYGREDYAGSIATLRELWDEDPALVLSSMQAERDLNLAKLGYMTGWCARENRTEDAILLSRINAETAQTEPRLWNDLGLFLRDHATGLRDRELAQQEFEASYDAYRRALALAPDDPQLLNDAAVVLDYYLERELDLALEMYERAREIAEAGLDAGTVAEEDLEVWRIALRDARNNSAKLRRKLDR